MRHVFLLLMSCCLLTLPLSADPVYTYTATSVHMFVIEGQGFANINAGAPGFSLTGGAGGGFPTVFRVGDQVPLTMFFASEGDNDGATVDFGGIVQDTNSITGSVSVNALSSSVFVIPPNPSSTYTFSAQATGQFTALPACGPPPYPVCGTSANLVIAEQGGLTLTLIPFGPGVYEVNENFVGSPVPEPSSSALLLLGAVMVGGILFSRKRKSRCEDCPY